ncbi:SDR family oxidoreductase [Paenibacillus xerothermodurans]|uniref:SDR family NAD(P)-dependent oxidoreductase n=1 Tax=Paenibacillus xerothermodurans TaxID=1977292 RepID=A0A2W1P1I0_PAEXE|nr:SDR family oxidoreductase [Paenibacillus xerothermodurans]PZE21602.1 SDR family NAD(P)-dependent oxidoreductase [Paenibacillus xerothermodurans]
MENKAAIITGASSGIGEATAKELAKQGLRVMLAARREDRLRQLAEEINQTGGQVVYKVTDVTSRNDMEALAKETIESFGQIDILINNAGVMPLSFINKLKVDEWDRMVDVNIKGVLYGIAAVYPHMAEQNDGHIINVSSVAGHEIFPTSAVYSATKHAVRAITEGLRKELSAEQKIRTTIISPGAVATELTHTITDEDVAAVFSRMGDIQPLRPQDIANAIVYAIQQPPSVSVNEIIVRPTSQP